jgi:penicillin-binding protein 1B
LLEDVIDHGTGAGVRARGFTAPAAGKTGTSHDGWFAGFTSDLLCVVWVGFDDNRELGLSGASSAAPIWAEFMKRAVAAPALSTVEGVPAEFAPPEGIIAVAIDPDTLQLATPSCPAARQEYFVAGTEPVELCARHGGRTLAQAPGISWLARLFGGKKPEPAPSGARRGDEGSEAKDGADASRAQSGKLAKSPEEEKKKGFLQRVFGIFGGKKPKDSPKPAPAKP